MGKGTMVSSPPLNVLMIDDTMHNVFDSDAVMAASDTQDD
jgi:hypothetical protein